MWQTWTSYRICLMDGIESEFCVHEDISDQYLKSRPAAIWESSTYIR